MTLIDDIKNMTETMESSVENVVYYKEAYMLLMRALIEIRQLNHKIAVLEDKVVNQ